MTHACPVSIVVLTYNRRDEVLRTLQRLARLHADVPVIVVDNASCDGTADAVARAFAHVQVVRIARNLGAAGRNAGVRACATPYVAFCDDDTWWERDALARVVAVLEAHPRLAVVTGRVLIGDDDREDPTSVRMAASPFPNTLRMRGTEVFGFLAGACAVRRSAFLSVGGYHPRYFLGGEEELLAIDFVAAGWRMGYVADAVVHHHPSSVRNVAVRRRLVPRNAIWSAWLRRPWRSAWRVTVRRLGEARRDRSLTWTAASALRGLPWVLRERRVIADDVEMAVRTRDVFDATPLGASAWRGAHLRGQLEWILPVDGASEARTAPLVAIDRHHRR